MARSDEEIGTPLQHQVLETKVQPVLSGQESQRDISNGILEQQPAETVDKTYYVWKNARSVAENEQPKKLTQESEPVNWWCSNM